MYGILATALVAYLPGALLFRLPVADRARRAGLPVDERVFWHVLLSLGWSLALVLALAAAGAYSLDRLLLVNGVLSAVLLAGMRGRALYRGGAPGLRWTVVLPVALIALGVWRFFPSSEYIIGGRDPGAYVNEGVQIAQRGGFVMHDAVVADLPGEALSLFVARNTDPDADYYGLRFMGFFVQDPLAGTVIGQFPHLYPASIALAYDIHGLTGARQVTGLWALLGLLAVYVAGVRLVGRPAACAAAVLFALQVIVVWYARFPNAEVVMLTLVFGLAAALARVHEDDDRFFAPVAGGLAGLLVFLRSDALLVLVGLGAALVLLWLVRGWRPPLALVVPVGLGVGLGGWYYAGPMRAYSDLPQVYLTNLPPGRVAAGVVAGLAALAGLAWLRRARAAAAGRLVPAAWAAVLLAAAGYAWFLREPGGKLTDYDAYALRTFTDFYLMWPALVAALVGLVLVAREGFWRNPALLLVFGGFSLFFFYKIRIVPEHFWATRRFLPVILPVALLLASRAALGAWRVRPSRAGRLRAGAGLVLLAALGTRYLAAAAPVMPHVEYGGIIPYLEQLAGRFGDRDLVLVESRNAGSDLHVLGLPLAYVHGRQVLVLVSPAPDKARLQLFLRDALGRYDRVFFLGGGGTDLLTRGIIATPVAGDTVQISEYDSPLNGYPAGPHRKEFDYTLYQLSLGEAPRGPFALDVGFEDDLHVVRFHAKERTEGRTIRWTGPQSFVAVTDLAGRERRLEIVMHDGGRPAGAPPAHVEVFLDDEPIGGIDVGSGFATYELPLPAALVERAAARADPARLRIVSTTWVPGQVLGGPDGRELGVMIDRVEIR